MRREITGESWRNPRCRRDGCGHLWSSHRSYLRGAGCKYCRGDCKRFRRWRA